MAVEAEVMECLFHVADDIRRIFVAVITGSTATAVYKVMVALRALAPCMITVFEGHRQHRLIFHLAGTIVFCGRQ